MKQFIVLLLVLVQYNSYSQNTFLSEKPPVFPNCEAVAIDSLQACFDKNIYNTLYEKFKVPEQVSKENYKGEVVVIFEVDTTGQFQVVYTDAFYDELKKEVKRLFLEFPKIKPATYNGKKTYKQYSISIRIPLTDQSVTANKEIKANEISKLEVAAKKEFDKIDKALKASENKAFKSQLNIQFTHSDYARFDRQMNLIGTNSHTASKPFVYEAVSNYYDFEAEQERLKKQTETWGGKKLWNEHLVELQGEDYWFTVDPILDLQVGKDTDAEFNSTFNNTRGFVIQGGLGKKLNFYSSVLKRFAIPRPGIIAGSGPKAFKLSAYLLT